jgi:hypothetical protein
MNGLLFAYIFMYVPVDDLVEVPKHVAILDRNGSLMKICD